MIPVRKRFFWAIAVLGGFIAALSMTGVRHALDWALANDARSAGGNWAQHIENQLPGLTGMQMPDGSLNVTQLPEPGEFEQIVAEVLSIGHIYQIDYINVFCMCDVSIGSFHAPGTLQTDTRHEGRDHSEHPDDAAPKPNNSDAPQLLPRARQRHVFDSTNLHREMPGAQSEFQLPVNRALVRQAIGDGQELIAIRQVDIPFQPRAFAEIYHPVIINDEPRYILRVLVNLEQQASRYMQFLILSTLLSLGGVIVVAGVPSWLYFKALHRQQETNQRLAFLAHHDMLTNLHNRNSFQSALSDTLWRCKELGQSALLFIFDINDFKDLNDYSGHEIGDQVLQEFARLLSAKAPDQSYIARLGADEFGVVIDGISEPVIDYRDYFYLPVQLSMPLKNTGQTIDICISGGVAQYPVDADTTASLIQAVDLAVHAAKGLRSGQICAYRPQMKMDFFNRLGLKEEFRDALSKDQIYPYYQPLVSLQTGKVEGFEALARWHHPEKGVLTPFVFDDIFSDPELSVLLGEHMFEMIADDMAQWTADDVPFGSVGLNVVDGDLNRDNLAQDLLSGLKKRGLTPKNLAIEVTENCLFGNKKEAFITHLEVLHDAGCYIALDDFGTGYSSITQLKDLPVTAVKIDKSFIDNVLADKNDQSIIDALMQLGQSMQFRLVLEGIETQAQLDFLSGFGCGLGQGYHFARPMPAVEVPIFLQQQNLAETKQRAIEKAS